MQKWVFEVLGLKQSIDTTTAITTMTYDEPGNLGLLSPSLVWLGGFGAVDVVLGLGHNFE